jgi:hypothetical protein
VRVTQHRALNRLRGVITGPEDGDDDLDIGVTGVPERR